MNNISVKRIFKAASRMIHEHTAEILTGLGIAGMITSTIMAVRATPKALHRIEEKKKELEVEKLTSKETAVASWKCYIPATLVGTLSVACLVGGSSVNLKRNAALATAYTISESALKEYQEKVVETIGEKKEEEVRDAVARDKVASKSVSEMKVYDTGKGNSLCFDPLSGRLFYSDFEFLRQCINDLNRQMMDEYSISLNEYYSAINLKPVDPRVGDILGWNVDKGFIELRPSSQLTEDHLPCMIIGFKYGPVYNFNH